MIRAVLDTNVWISGFLWQGAVRQLIELARTKRFVSVTCHSILHELSVVLVVDFETPPDRVLEIERSILSISELVALPSLISYPVRDPKDLHVISCAAIGRAERIVTGDRDLLSLHQIRNVRIVTIQKFLQELSQ